MRASDITDIVVVGLWVLAVGSFFYQVTRGLL